MEELWNTMSEEDRAEVMAEYGKRFDEDCDKVARMVREGRISYANSKKLLRQMLNDYPLYGFVVSKL